MADIESILAEYLSARLSVPVAADVPEDKPSSFVSFERTGGGFGSIVLDSPMVAVQCWADTRSEAKALAYEVDDLIRRMPGVYHNVADASRNSLYNFPDPNSRKARYQIVFEFIIQV